MTRVLLLLVSLAFAVVLAWNAAVDRRPVEANKSAPSLAPASCHVGGGRLSHPRNPHHRRERTLNRRVCRHEMSRTENGHLIRTDWVGAYRRYTP